MNALQFMGCFAPFPMHHIYLIVWCFSTPIAFSWLIIMRVA